MLTAPKKRTVSLKHYPISAMALIGADFRAPLRDVKRVQFGILSPDEIVSIFAHLMAVLRNWHESGANTRTCRNECRTG